MLVDQCYALGLFLLFSNLKKSSGEGALLDILLPHLDPPLGGSCRKASMHVQGHEYFLPTKFRKHRSIGSIEKARYVLLCIYMH